ncbi:MAG TPA: SMC-Scp complex subunit ScpB [Acidobacteriaceae bacterium]
MSLKAKMEAVIYASEEPVTLAQLVSLLGEEAQAELDRIAEAQQSLALNDRNDDDASDSAVATEDPAPVEEPVAAASDSSESAPTEPDATAATKAEKVRAQKLRAFFRAELDSLLADYSAPDSNRGIEIREIAGGFRFATKPECHDAVRGFVKSLKPPFRLSLPALETLAVIAYKQPVTAPEISEIRGVDSSGTLASLITRKLITTAGRKQVIGRPMLYKTSKDFLLKFGLKDLNELPSIEEFEKLAGQFAEQEDLPMSETSQQLESERNTHAPQADGFNAEEDSAGDISGAASNVSEETGDRASVDGRIASLPPNYAAEDLADDPSAQEAAIQTDEDTE